MQDGGLTQRGLMEERCDPFAFYAKYICHEQPKREKKLRIALQQTRATSLSCSSRCWIRRGRGPRRRGLRAHSAPRPRSPCGAPPCSLGFSLRAARRPGGGPVEGGHAVGDRPVFAVSPRSYSGVRSCSRNASRGHYAARGHVEAGRRGRQRAASAGAALERRARGICGRRGWGRAGQVFQPQATAVEKLWESLRPKGQNGWLRRRRTPSRAPSRANDAPVSRVCSGGSLPTLDSAIEDDDSSNAPNRFCRWTRLTQRASSPARRPDDSN